MRDSITKEKLSKLTHYGSIIKSAPVLISVFLDRNQMYDRIKDVQSTGACIQNMLLAPDPYELMAVVALGYPVIKERVSERKEHSDLVFREKFGNGW